MIIKITKRSFTHFIPNFHFYTPPQKRQKTFGSQRFPGGIEIKHWAKMGQFLKSEVQMKNISKLYFLK